MEELCHPMEELCHQWKNVVIHGRTFSSMEELSHPWKQLRSHIKQTIKLNSHPVNCLFQNVTKQKMSLTGSL